MTRVIEVAELERVLPTLELMAPIEAGFAAYSRGEAIVPPVGELSFEDPPGDVHIKYGAIRKGGTYLVKIASGFYQNPQRGLPVSNGLMIAFDSQTGAPRAVLLDQGLLTRTRTAIAGAIAAKHLAPRKIDCIGIIGTGTQAHLQLQYLAGVLKCRRAMVLSRSAERARRYAQDLAAHQFEVGIAADVEQLFAACQLVVTTTPARSPVVPAEVVRPGTHITAVGADTPQKQELATGVLGKADIVVADSIAQCRERGEISHALRDKSLRAEDVRELGAVIDGRTPGRTRDDQISVADLTGVVVQDIQIASAVLERIAQNR
jgi:ornithine cyclodeaminase